MNKFLKKHYIKVSVLLIFIIYLFTLAPSVVEIDSGELATVQATLGIAHPTGYPLFTLIGHLFYLLPLPFTKIYQLNLLAAVWCSLSIGIFIYTSKFLLDNIPLFNPASNKKKPGKSKKNNAENPVTKIQDYPEHKKILAALLGGLVLAFNKTFWFQSTSVEVYSLHIFLILLVILFLLKSFLYVENTDKSFLKSPWIIFSILLALSFTNHMTTILILPGTAYLFFSKYKFNKSSFKKLGLMLLFFFPVLMIIYSYLPLRASQNPLLNWGDPVNFENFIRHISGKQYLVWLFASASAAKKQLLYFINELPVEFSASLFIILIGIFNIYKISKKLFIFLLITFLSTVLYSINYDINDIDSYFLLAYITLSFFAVFGILKLLKELKHRKYSYKISVVFIVLIIGSHFYVTLQEANKKDNYVFEDYTKALLSSTSVNSVVISYQWDYFISASYYFQLVEKLRKDVKIVDKELLRRSWYYNQLNVDHPDLLAGMKQQVNNFIARVKPFERDEKYNPAVIENAYQAVLTGLVSTNIDSIDVYIAPELFENEMQKGEFRLPTGYTIVPDIFLFKVVKTTDYVPAAKPEFKLRLPAYKDKYVKFIENTIGNMLARRALYELRFNKTGRAKLYIKKIRESLPDYLLPENLGNIF
ncbi:MAG TPA: DUF2723 domain-containing protein [Ignavibacteriaceae bacterium]|nr:DUF2723 domain-containing protein [Ignavibacteriaceae bacterium]